MKINKICIVGYGSHVEKTIIPSLTLNKKNIKIITSKSNINGFTTYPSLKTGLKMITKDYIFFNSTPPNLHYSTSKLILSSGFNLIVEKPVCLSVIQLEKLRKLAQKKKLFIYENMMYLHTKQFSLFKKHLKKKNLIRSIYLNFSIPKFNKNSFRIKKNLNSSLLYDVGCYPFSLISYFKFKIKNFLISYKFKNKLLSKLNVKFRSENIDFFITISFFEKYKNFAKINFVNKSSLELSYFFYGKKIMKHNSFIFPDKKKIVINCNESNIFRKIFNFEKRKFFELSKKNHIVTRDYLIILNKIKKLIIQ